MLVDVITKIIVRFIITVVPVMNGHPRDQAKVSVRSLPLIIGNLTLKCVGQGFDNVAVQGRWPLTTGVAQGRYYCIYQLDKNHHIADTNMFQRYPCCNINESTHYISV